MANSHDPQPQLWTLHRPLNWQSAEVAEDPDWHWAKSLQIPYILNRGLGSPSGTQGPRPFRLSTNPRSQAEFWLVSDPQDFLSYQSLLSEKKFLDVLIWLRPETKKSWRKISDRIPWNQVSLWSQGLRVSELLQDWLPRRPRVSTYLDLDLGPGQDLVAQGRKLVFENQRTERPLWSLIIPSYNHGPELEESLKALSQLKSLKDDWELLVLDDGSTDDTLTRLKALGSRLPLPLQVWSLPRLQPRRWGDESFRAGSVRNLGVRLSRGSRLLFLDADILCPPNLLHQLDKDWSPRRVQQFRRWQLCPGFGFAEIESHWDDFWPQIELSTGSYWEDFQLAKEPWLSRPHPWKWFSSFGFAVEREFFEKIGGFRESFKTYGFEDTELGFRFHRGQAELRVAEVDVFHQNRPEPRSEHQALSQKKKELLCRAFPRFLEKTLDAELLEALPLYSGIE